MKFNQKIFLMSHILVTIAIFIIGYLMITNNHKTSIDSQIEKSIFQINRIRDEFDLYGQSIIPQIAAIYRKENVHIEILSNNKILYTNLMQIDQQLKEKIIPEKNCINSYIEKDTLFLCFQTEDSIIYTTTDISSIFQTRTDQIVFFIKISIICSLLISATLYIGTSIITRKIKQLNKAANEVQKGNYNIEVKDLGKDEIGILGKTFNEMTNAIYQNINHITKISEDRKNFIGNLTHEIRTPLTSIIGYSSLIKNKKILDQEIIEDYANRINEEGNYIKKISEKLMNLLLLENEMATLHPILLSKELEKDVLELSQIFKQTNLRLEIEESIWINSDETLLKSLINNLVKNAIQSYNEDNDEKEVVIKLDRQAVIQIIDYGKGIPKEEIEKIKTPFYTLNQDRNREHSGMGLGLPLCFKIVETHKGKLEIQSQEKKGTIITINLGEKIDEK